MKTSDIKVLAEDRVTPLLAYNDDLALAGKMSKEAIDSLTRQIKVIEGAVEKRIDLRRPYEYLLSIPGVGKVLALTMMLETGPIERFEKVGNYASYCRKVPSSWRSNDKKKGKGNVKNGNKYLAWAYSEAYHAELVRLSNNANGMGTVDCSGGCTIMRVSLIKEDSMSKENTKQKQNPKKKPQHTLKEKRQAKREKAEGKSPQIMPR